MITSKLKPSHAPKITTSCTSKMARYVGSHNEKIISSKLRRETSSTLKKDNSSYYRRDDQFSCCKCYHF
jgi:hypothetical protein